MTNAAQMQCLRVQPRFIAARAVAEVVHASSLLAWCGRSCPACSRFGPHFAVFWVRTGPRAPSEASHLSERFGGVCTHPVWERLRLTNHELRSRQYLVEVPSHPRLPKIVKKKFKSLKDLYDSSNVFWMSPCSQDSERQSEKVAQLN